MESGQEWEGTPRVRGYCSASAAGRCGVGRTDAPRDLLSTTSIPLTDARAPLDDMMRQSIAPLRQSHVPGQPPNAAALAKLTEKKKEFEAVSALEKASAKFIKRIEEIGDDFETMADAGLGA